MVCHQIHMYMSDIYIIPEYYVTYGIYLYLLLIITFFFFEVKMDLQIAPY